MAEPKTQRTKESVTAFIRRVADEGRRKGCAALVRLMKRAAGAPAKMSGTGIIGFGIYPIQYAGGKTGAGPMLSKLLSASVKARKSKHR